MIQFNNVKFRYNDGTDPSDWILSNVNLRIERGEFVSIIGPSGAGKSTLLALIAGLEGISGGSLTIDKEEISGPHSKADIVFQDYGLYPWLNVARNVEFGLKIRGVERSERNDRVNQVLKRVGLEKDSKRYPHQLSGGMRQRVAIARVLANDSPYILMDEPFGALDYQTRHFMQQFLLEIWEGFGKTIVFVTHHIDEAVRLSGRVLALSSGPGRIACDVVIDLEYPREATDPKLMPFRNQLTAHLEREVSADFEP